MFETPNPGPNFIRFLVKYDIKYSLSGLYLTINDDNLFYQLVVSNDISTMENMVDELRHFMYINESVLYELVCCIYRFGTMEMITHFINLFEHQKLEFGSEPIFKSICTRSDDNLEIFQICCSIFNFPKKFTSLATHEKYYVSNESHCRILMILHTTIDFGNYKIFEYCIKVSDLNKNLKRICSALKKYILSTNNFSHNIFDILIKDYIDIDINDLQFLLDQKKYPQLEYIIHLVQKRVIIFTDDELNKLIQYESPENSDLLRQLIS
jgi:hypothetical protein